MAQPASIVNTLGQSTDTLINIDGTPLVKLGIGSVAPASLTPAAGWQGVASHIDGATFVTGDGVAVMAGLDGTTVRPILVDSSGNILAALTSSGGNLTDRSGTLTTGGTAEQVAAANTTRRYFMIQNLDASEDMWIDFGSTAVADQPSIKLVAGEKFIMDGNFVSTQAVSIIAATTGHKWAAKEG